MKDEFIIDNENQVKVPLGLVKKFNQIPFRRVTFDFMVPAGMLRMFSHSLCLDVEYIDYEKYKIKPVVEKTRKFYCNLLIADYIRTSNQTNNYSLLNLIENKE